MPVLLTLLVSIVQAKDPSDNARYRNNREIQEYLQSLQKENPSGIALHQIAVSPGGNEVTLIEIGSNRSHVPAIFVGANFEGNSPLSAEGALALAKMVIDSSRYTQKLKWFILPQPNPDAAAAFFAPVKWERTVNNLEVNNDTDDQINEDGPDDLDGNGMITLIRVEDPEGSYVVSNKDPRLMVRADPRKGERGKFKIYPEGLDNDGDGSYNEDGPGGVNIGISFPHLFNPRNKESGLWPGESPETYGIMKFIFDHPEIVMAYTLGSSDFCLDPPRNNRTGGANLESIKVPARYASRFGIDPEKTYTMAQIMEIFRAAMPEGGREVTPDMIASFLGLGAAINPLEDDLKFYTAFSGQYKEFLKLRGITTERMPALPDRDGSFELWAYYQLGIPSFSMNLFTIPKPPVDKIEEGASSSGSNDKSAPGNGMIKNANQAVKVPDAEEIDRITLAYLDKYRNGEGFIPWKPFDHPTLGMCEIGGLVPFVASTPPAGMIDSLCSIQLPWLLQLTTKLPDIRLLNEKITNLGAGIYKLELFVENMGTLPYPIAMGSRNKQPALVMITLDGEDMELLEGFKRTPLGDIGGNQVKKLTWMIKADKKGEITVKIESAPFGTSSKQIRIGG